MPCPDCNDEHEVYLSITKFKDGPKVLLVPPSEAHADDPDRSVLVPCPYCRTPQFLEAILPD